MKTSVYNQKGEIVGDVELNSKIFEVKANTHLMAEAVRTQRSNARGGNAHTKTRAEVSGGGKKPWKQKGTGRARAGSNRSPIWRHGGVTFGPRSTRNWELKMNKKAKTQALFMSLTDKASEKQFIVIDQIALDQAKTKEFVKMFTGLQGTLKSIGKKQLLITPKKDDKISRSSRNLKSVKLVSANSLNIIDIMTAETLIVLKDSLPVIEKTYLKSK
jgi:large subunit ribosomal protein L4